MNASKEDDTEVGKKKAEEYAGEGFADEEVGRTRRRSKNSLAVTLFALGAVVVIAACVSTASVMTTKQPTNEGHRVPETDNMSGLAAAATNERSAAKSDVAGNGPAKATTTLSIELDDGFDVDSPAEPELSFGDLTLQPLSTAILDGYDSWDEFEEALTNLVKWAVNHIILKNIEEYEANSDIPTFDDDDMVWDDDDPMSDYPPAVTARSGTSTNNKEDDADEGDLVKTDGDYVYYADYKDLVVWDTEGNFVTHIDRSRDSNGDYVYVGEIEAILTTKDHVVVVAYGKDRDYVNFEVLESQNRTRLEVFTKPTPASPQMTMLGYKNLHGLYWDGFWLKDTNTIHVASKSEVDSYDLTRYLGIDSFPWFSKEEYIAAATNLATKRLIPKYVRALTREIMASSGGQLPDMLQFNSWGEPGKQEELTSFYKILDEFIQVTSLNLDTLPAQATEDELEVATAVVMTPDLDSKSFYGTDDSLILSVGIERYDEETWESRHKTHLFKLNVVADGVNFSTTFHSMATLDGRLATEEYSIDMKGNDLRVATTADSVEIPFSNITAVCGYQGSSYDQCMREDAWFDCEAAVNSCDTVVKAGCPYNFTCANGSPILPVSSVWNHITVLDTTQEGAMTELGWARIGEPNEVVFSVRFGENFSYAVTFDQSDPFYVLNLEAGQAPKVEGSLVPNGYYTYLHPMNEEQTMIVAIGQNTTVSGWWEPQATGLMVAVFDVEDPKNPQVLDYYTFEDHEDVDSESSAETNPKAVQYTNGYLIIPLEIEYSYYASYDDDDASNSTKKTVGDLKEFDGFVVLDLNGAADESIGIKEVFRVSHPSSYYSSKFRSYVIEDKLLTLGGKYLVCSNMTTGEQLWNLTLNGNDDDWY